MVAEIPTDGRWYDEKTPDLPLIISPPRSPGNGSAFNLLAGGADQFRLGDTTPVRPLPMMFSNATKRPLISSALCFAVLGCVRSSGSPSQLPLQVVGQPRILDGQDLHRDVERFGCGGLHNHPLALLPAGQGQDQQLDAAPQHGQVEEIPSLGEGRCLVAAWPRCIPRAKISPVPLG